MPRGPRMQLLQGTPRLFPTAYSAFAKFKKYTGRYRSLTGFGRASSVVSLDSRNGASLSYQAKQPSILECFSGQ